MLSEELKQKTITYDGQLGLYEQNINGLIEIFETCGNAEFTYKNKIYYVRRETAPDERYLPAIGTNINFDKKWLFFETWENLIEHFKFPDNKTMLQILFE